MTAPLLTVGEAISQARAHLFPFDAPVVGVRRIIGVQLGVNVNTAATDTPISLLLLANCNFVLRGVQLNNAVVNNAGTITNSLTTATAGVFTGAGGTGVTLVTTAALSGLTTLSGAGSNLDMTLATQAVTLNQLAQANVLYFRVTTAQGASTSATVDVYLWGEVLP